MVQTDHTTQLKLKLGAFRLEFEGREDFLMSEVPDLIESMDKLQVSTLKIPFKLVQTALDDALVTQADIDDAIEKMKNDLDSISELGEMESLRLQQAMDRISKMMSTLSNLLKKASDTASGIIQNLK